MIDLMNPQTGQRFAGQAGWWHGKLGFVFLQDHSFGLPLELQSVGTLTRLGGSDVVGRVLSENRCILQNYESEAAKRSFPLLPLVMFWIMDRARNGHGRLVVVVVIRSASGQPGIGLRSPYCSMNVTQFALPPFIVFIAVLCFVIIHAIQPSLLQFHHLICS